MVIEQLKRVAVKNDISLLEEFKGEIIVLFRRLRVVKKHLSFLVLMKLKEQKMENELMSIIIEIKH